MNRIMATAAAILAAACAEGMDMSGYEKADAGTQAPPAKNYLVALKSNHAHIYKKVAQVFTVHDMDGCTNAKDLATCPKVKGLPVTAFTREPGDAYSVDQALAPGKLEDMGDGTYTFYTQFGALGSHVAGLRFAAGGSQYFGAFALETSRGGGEKYFCDENADSSTDFAYQVRWSGSSAHLMADGKTEITFGVEPMRSLAGQPVNTTSPWLNTFDHLPPAELENGAPVVKLMGNEAATAEEVATLTPTYAGKGIYNVKHVFAKEEVMDSMGRTFWLKISFKDSHNCTVDGAADPDSYYFPVMPNKEM